MCIAAIDRSANDHIVWVMRSMKLESLLETNSKVQRIHFFIFSINENKDLWDHNPSCNNVCHIAFYSGSDVDYYYSDRREVKQQNSKMESTISSGMKWLVDPDYFHI